MLNLLPSSFRQASKHYSCFVRSSPSVLSHSFASLFSFMGMNKKDKNQELEERKALNERFFVESTKLTIAPHLEPAFLFVSFFFLFLSEYLLSFSFSFFMNPYFLS